MNRLLISAAIVAIGMTSVVAQSVKSGRWYNGQAWKVFDEKQKLVYVTAFQEGYGIALLDWMAKSPAKPSMEELKEREDSYIAGGAFTAQDYVDQIDRFYTDPGNDSIPIPYAYRYVVKKFQG